MHFTRARDLVIAGLVGLLLGFVGLQLAYRSLPRLPAPAGLTLLVLAVVEAVLAFVLRSRIRAGRVRDAVPVARSVALAKASSLLGALMLGLWLGVLGYLLPRVDQLLAAADDLPGAVIGAICAALLVGAALWLEQCCRTPDRRDPDEPGAPTG